MSTDFAAQADIINEASTDSAPEMPSPPDPHVQLMRGIYQKTDTIDKWHDVAEIRELTGEDEEYLDSVAGKKEGLTFTQYMTLLLQRGVLSIGDLDVQSHPEVVNKLIMADRELLFLALVKATYGNERSIRAICGNCGQDNTIVIELDKDFDIREPEFDPREDQVIHTSKGDVRLKLPNGEDMDAVQADQSLSDAQGNTILLSRCAVWPEGEGPVDKQEWARKLNVGDRKKLLNAIVETSASFGPDLKGVDTQCAECGKDMAISLDWVSLLFG